MCAGSALPIVAVLVFHTLAVELGALVVNAAWCLGCVAWVGLGTHDNDI